MADNTQLSTNIGTGDKALTFEVTFSGDAGVKLQGVALMGISGTAETWTFAPINGDATNGLDVDVTRIAAGANLIGDVGIGTRTSGGATSYRTLDADENGVNVKASTGQVYWISATNIRTSPLYLKLYNKASAPNSGDTPVHTFLIPSQGSANGGGFFLLIPFGIPFAAGIGFRVTTGVADADTGANAPNECVLNIGYK